MPPEQFYSTELMKDLTDAKVQELSNSSDYKIICITCSYHTVVLDYSNQCSADIAFNRLQGFASDAYINIIKLY
jgi:hypothetical protein